MKLLIVDDSALMRRQLGGLFGEHGYELRYARNGRDAVAQNLEFLPDVVTLDINMPEMDGLAALAEMMVTRPVPVVMLSSLTEKGALATFEALNLGAVDFVAKPGGTISLSLDAISKELLSKVRAAARARVARTAGGAAAGPPEARSARGGAGAGPAAAAPVPAADAPAPGVASAGVVLIGVSTGGPRTLEAILPPLPASFPWPVVVAQHMPASFTGPFAQRLDGLCRMRVVEASRQLALEPGTIYVCKGGADAQIVNRGGRNALQARPEHAGYLWHPSVELLGRSALECYPHAAIIAVMLTGMGYDGAEAFAEIARRGGRTIAESEDTAVVFGMPAELMKRGGAQLVLPAERIAAQLLLWAA
ncbi:chemotaxis-specific protein-glutamate methyltransferase CheB [Oxalobacteraceae bacterium A2-2]